MNKGFSKIWLIGILALLVGGGISAWQWFGALGEISKNNIAITYTSENYAWGEQIQRIEISKKEKL